MFLLPLPPQRPPVRKQCRQQLVRHVRISARMMACVSLSRLVWMLYAIVFVIMSQFISRWQPINTGIGTCKGVCACIQGFTGATCAETLTPGQSKGDDNNSSSGLSTGGILGIVLGVFIVASIVLLIIFLKRRPSKDPSDTEVCLSIFGVDISP